MMMMIDANNRRIRSSPSLHRISRSSSKTDDKTDDILTTTTLDEIHLDDGEDHNHHHHHDEKPVDSTEMGELSRSSRQVSTSTTTFPTTIEMNSSDESSSEPEKSKSTAAADEEDEDEDDPWADVDDDDETMLKSGKLNIVDQMRQLREQGRYIPYELTTNHMNETISRVVSAYEILDQYYLPSRETWEKLLGLVTGLDVTVQPECFASYFQGVSGFRGYETWAYRCMYYFCNVILFIQWLFF